jgi:hypothetical protein
MKIILDALALLGGLATIYLLTILLWAAGYQ